MGEEVRMTDYEFAAAAAAGDEEEARVVEWEDGLPGVDDLTPLSQSLVPPELASAFSISPEPSRSLLDVNRASQDTLSGLRSQSFAFSSNNFKSFNDDRIRDSQVVEGDEDTREGWAAAAIAAAASDSRKLRRLDCAEEADSALRQESSCADDPAAAAGRGGMKRPRLVWTPQLHKRFVDVVGHLGIQNAVPKTIMQLMNVDGLTRENVASHLQKYRLYLKRMQGLPSNEGNSVSDVFASTPVQHNSQESGGHANGNGNGHMPPVPYPMPYGTPVMQMPFYGHMGMPPGGAVGYHGFESYPYTMQQRDWSGNKFGTVVPYHHATTQNDK